jgi:hypothetical protein
MSLRWVQPRALQPTYELRAGEQVAATLVFCSAFSSLATGESADGCWTFKRLGFVKTTVRTRGSKTDIALLRNSCWGSGGWLEMSDGRRFPARTNVWATRYQLLTEAGGPLVTFSHIGGLLRLSGNVVVHEAARSMPELPWLVLLGWYQAVLMYRDSAVAVA